MTELISFIHWAPDPIIFDLFGRGVRWYGLMFATGLFGAFLITDLIFKGEKINSDFTNKLLLYVTIGALVGARLGQVFFYQFEYYWMHPGEIIQIWKGGLASHGAVIGISLMIFLFAKRVMKKPFFWVGDRAVSGIALAAAFIRFGNLSNSEIIGKPSDVPWAFIFEKVDMIPRHPSQLYEGLAYVLLSIFLFITYRKGKGKLPTGYVSGLFFTGMFFMRFLLEFFKNAQVDLDETFFLNIGQLLSLPFIVLGLALIYFSRYSNSQAIEKF